MPNSQSGFQNEARNSAGVAAIAIGRNEGDRLKACLASLEGNADPLVYVDSGSSDDSVAFAKSIGVDVVSLDMSVPFTAARARNAGFERIRELAGPDGLPTYVQFVDGDCEVVTDWVAKAKEFLDANKEVAIVCGRRRERHPEASVFNRLCDIEWATPVGEAKSSGGDFLCRADAFDAVGGFNPALIAGEEPDLCFRLREQGWKIWRLDADMTLHDAAMTRLGQWWTRMKRAGFAYASGNAMHGRSPEKFWGREVLRAVLFGGVLPVAAVLGAILVHPASLALLGVYPLQAARTYVKLSDLGAGRLAYALSCTFGKIPEFAGVVSFWTKRVFGQRAELIEYK
ncbi:MAG: glycosyltransferase [Pseudomonadota bacterium]